MTENYCFCVIKHLHFLLFFYNVKLYSNYTCAIITIMPLILSLSLIIYLIKKIIKMKNFFFHPMNSFIFKIKLILTSTLMLFCLGSIFYYNFTANNLQILLFCYWIITFVNWVYCFFIITY